MNAILFLWTIQKAVEDHLQIVNAIAIAIQYYGGDELKQLVSNLQTFSQTLLYEIYTTKVQREASSVKSAAWVCQCYVGMCWVCQWWFASSWYFCTKTPNKRNSYID